MVAHMKSSRIRRPSARRRGNRRGSLFVELSLIFVAFATMLIGAFDFGQFLFVHHALVERARYAARWGAINNPADTASISNMVLYDQSTTPPQGTGTYFGLTPANVTVTNADDNTDKHRLNLTISGYSFSILSPYIAGNFQGAPINVSVPLGLYD